MCKKGGCNMDDSERIILDVNGKELEMLNDSYSL